LDDEQNIPGTLFIHEKAGCIYYFLLVLDDDQNIPRTFNLDEGLDVHFRMIGISLEPSSTKGLL
jgi:hypothetical protein